MDEEKAEQTSGSLGIQPETCGSSEPNDEVAADSAGEMTQALAKGSVDAPVSQQPADLESPLEASLANEPVAASEIAEPVACEATEVVNVDAARADRDVAEMSCADAVSDAPAAAKAEAAAEAEAPRAPGKLLVLAPQNRDRAHGGAGSQTGKREWTFDRRRVAAVAAVVALATVAGALGGAMATASLMRGAGHTASGNTPLEASVARIDAEILALKAGLENNSKLATNQFGKTSDRLDRIEKAQAEPAARLTRLSEAVDKLRAAPVPLPSPPPIAAPATTTAVKEVTGSVTAAPAPPKTEVGRLPTVEGWVLRDVAYGGALIEGRRGVYEVYAGDPVPGLGRVDAIRRQDGRWVVVTSRGLIVAR
jgi:hypothetical protein